MATSTIKSANTFSGSVSSNGVKTKGQLANELYALIDKSKITGNSKLEEITSSPSMSIYPCTGYNSALVTFVRPHSASNYIFIDEWQISESSKVYEAYVGASSFTRGDETNTIMPSGYTYRVRY